jgi:hypothetical protein
MCIGRITAAFVLFVGALAATARADVVFNNFGPGDAFAASGRILEGESVGMTADVDQAASFTVGTVGAFLTDVTLGIGVRDSPAIGTGPLDVILAADAAGLPGAALRTLPINVNSTGDQTVTVSDGGTLLLTANTTYWVIADAKTTFDGAWRFNSTGDVGNNAGRSNIGPWTLFSNDDRYALRVEGRPAVPEPATIVLVGTALTSICSCCRRNRARRSD